MGVWVWRDGGDRGGKLCNSDPATVTIFFAKNFSLVKRCDAAMKKRHCRLVSAVFSRGALAVSDAAGMEELLTNARRHLW